MRGGFGITLPVAVGVEAITQTVRQNVSSAGLQLRVIVTANALKQILETEGIGLLINRTVYEKNNVVLHCNQTGFVESSQSCIPICQQEDPHMAQYRCFPFSIRGKLKTNGLMLQYRKATVNFCFMPVAKAKFVKNERLAAVMSEKEESWGLLSMDKSHRMMLQGRTTTFPIIGVWSTGDYTVTSPQTMCLLDSYLSQSYANKCKFMHERRAHIYFVRINHERRMPELYLVEYLMGEELTDVLQINNKELDNNREIVVQSGERSSLQFTLRSDEKVPEKLMDISCSPIKFNDYRPFLDDSEGQKLPESPRFKVEDERLTEKECNSLKILVKRQAIEINELKAELLKLTGEIRAQRKHANCCYSDSSMLSRLSVSKQRQSVAVCKKLTSSDLNLDSISTKSQLHPESSNSSCSKTPGEQQQIWNRFQLQEGR